MRRPRSSLMVLSFLAACGGLKEPVDPPGGPHVLGTYDPLRRVGDCAELEEVLKEEARERLRRSVTRGTGTKGDGDTADPGGSTGGTGGIIDGGSGGTGTGGAGGGGGAGGTGAAAGNTGSETHSDTNTQVDGVDEADFIKTDGEWIYVVKDGRLYVSQAWPVADLQLAALGAIEGHPFDMFIVENDPDSGLSGRRTVVVYSVVDGTDVYERAGVEPPSTGVGGWGGGPIGDGTGVAGASDTPGTTGTGGAGGGTGDTGGTAGVGGAGAVSGGSDPYTFGQGPGAYWLPNPLIKLTVLSGEPGALELEDGFYLEGSYVSARRNAMTVRTALGVNPPDLGLKTYPTEDDQKKAVIVLVTRLMQEGRDVDSIPSDELSRMLDEVIAEMLIEENEALIEGLDYRKWLPHTFHEEKGKMKARSVACEDFYVPPPAAGDGGLTHVAQVDLHELEASSLAVLGRTDTLYENEESFVLAASGSRIVDGAWSDEPATYLHWFGISDSKPLTYRASGIVPGFVDNQFAIDEADGALRVASTTGGWFGETKNFVSVLKADEHTLEIVGQVGPLAVGEQIYSVRYVGNTAYVVTFRQVDPLFVVDLEDPEEPKLLGELKIPGFSEYMHPLGADHLLTVGRDGDASGNVGNVALQIFDVKNPIAPKLAHKFVFDKFGGTEGLVTHKAVTYFAEQNLLALPFSADYWSPTPESSLELFHVDVESGFEPRGALSGLGLLAAVEQPGSGYFCDAWAVQTAAQFRRGVFIDEVLYGVAYKGIIAASVDAPETPIATLRFEGDDFVPTYCSSDGSGGVGGTGGDTGGVGGGPDTGGVGGGPDTGTGGAGGDPGTGGTGGGPDAGGTGAVAGTGEGGAGG